MKKTLLFITLLTIGSEATDFSQMSIEELNNLRGNVPAAERDAYKAEVQNRLKQMDEKQRNMYREERRNASGNGSMKRYRDGSGGGGHQGGGRHHGRR